VQVINTAQESDTPAVEPRPLADDVAFSAPTTPSRSRLHTFSLVAAVVLLNALGDLSLTWGLRHEGNTLGVNPLHYLQAMLNPFVAAGITMLIFWLLTRMALMSWADLSFVLPMTSTGYVLVAVLGRFLLNEHVSRERWVGVFLILCGAALVSTSAHQRTSPPQVVEIESEL
jgi:drug/metabolite transporter (DMT)-like permease